MAIGIGILGASGKMGQKLLKAGSEDPEIFVAGKASRVCHFDDLQQADLLIDFSHASLWPTIAEFGLRTKKPLVIGTTGHSEQDLETMKDLSQHLPIFHAPNFSLGVAVFLEIVKKTTVLLPEYFSVAIKEVHHIHKKDSPSGTALALAKAIEKKNPKIHSTRDGEVIGEHEVLFSAPEEEITIAHSTKSRDLFAKGALVAAKFLIKQPAGLYTMKDLL